jgi:hypothetical protein
LEAFTEVVKIINFIDFDVQLVERFSLLEVKVYYFPQEASLISQTGLHGKRFVPSGIGSERGLW